MKSLFELHRDHLGNVSDKWSIYLTEYDRIFARLRDKPIKILEIGVQNGGSLEVWAKYFPNATIIVGCDIDENCANLQFKDPRINIVAGDASSAECEVLVSHCSDNFDIIIDDGSHTSSDIIKSFARYFPRLRAGGVYIAEDLHCSYWKEFEGGLYHPYSSIQFFKALADIINYEHWGIEKDRAGLLARFSEELSIYFDETSLRHIHSLEFFNSVCAVIKESTEKNTLGDRLVSGLAETVVSGLPKLSGKPGSAINQHTNYWSTLAKSPTEAWEETIKNETLLRQQIEIQQKEITHQGSKIFALDKVIAERDQHIETLSRVLTERNEHIHNLSNVITEIHGSKSWRISKPYRMAGGFALAIKSWAIRVLNGIRLRGGILNTIKRMFAIYRQHGLVGLRISLRSVLGSVPLNPVQSSGIHDRNDYVEWVRRYDTLTVESRNKMREMQSQFDLQPLISVVMPTYNPKPEWLIEAIESVRNQIYPNWELCIADDASTDSAIRPILEGYATKDSRIKVVFREQNGHISAASNSALGVATGEWIALLDHDDLLAEHALFWVIETINRHPDAGLIYSDEEKVTETGERLGPYFKCDWNPDLFYSHNMITHLGTYNTDLVRDLGGFRLGFEGAQDYDLALRCIERLRTDQIVHIPRVLYHWRIHEQSTASSGDAKPYAMLAGERAINDHFQRTNVKGKVKLVVNCYQPTYDLPESPPLVSIIIPTRNGLKLLKQCIDSIYTKTTYPNYELIVVDNGSDDPETLMYLQGLSDSGKVRIIRDDSPFNYSYLNNKAVATSRGELLTLLNNDIEVITPDWLSIMVSHAIRPQIGAVGAKLWYTNKKLQHGGVILGIGGIAGHSHRHLTEKDGGYFSRAMLTQNLSAITAACLVIKKEIFNQVGGLDEKNLAVAFNDVDFCLRVRELGYRNVWTPVAELFHHESATRGYEDTPEKKKRFRQEGDYMKMRWGEELLNDPAYSPNLTLDYEDFSYAWPPRIEVI
jgi:glycosyltransferase involved in cell wall biosynthesis/cephalosporin hydroxylase